MSLWLKAGLILLFIAYIDSMQWREPTSWTFMGVLDGFDYSRGNRAYFWKPNCPHGFLRVGDAVTTENIIPTQVIACVFGQDYEITPISHEMMTLIYDPPSSDLLFYRGFAPGPVAMLGTMVTTKASFTPEVGRGKRSTEGVQAVDPNLQFFAAFIGPCLGTHQWCDGSTRFESANQFIIGFNPFEKLHFSMPGNLFLPSSNPNPSILGCIVKKCACGGCIHGNCSEDGRCDCHPQWMGLSCDKDINECAQGVSQCDPLVECINEMPGYSCGPCPAGFIDVFNNGTLCDDIDECADPQLNNCAELGLNCTNLPGRFQCTDCEIGSYRPTPGSQCRFQSCGNGVWDDKEDCDGGLGCFANNCTCAPLWEPTQPRSPDCRRLCGNLRLDLPEEQCDGGEGCRSDLCICNTGRGYRPINSTSCGFILTDPDDILCARLSGNGCEECSQFNCIWCPNEEISCVPRSRPTGGCTSTCNGSIVVPVDDGGSESLNKLILIISLVGAAVIVVTGIGIGVIVIYRRRKRLKRLEEERLLDLERKRMAAVSKYGIARSEVGQAPAGEWNPPDDSSLILVEQLPFTMSKTVFDFHNGENQFKVNSLYVDRFTMSLKDKVPKPPKKKHKKIDEDKVPLVPETERKKRSGEADEVHFVFHNVDSHKYRLEFVPNSGFLKKGKDLDVTVTMEVKMTADVDLVTGIELPDYHQHSFVMSPITSELSSFIDLDEVQLDSRKPVGDGAFGTVYKGVYRGQDVAVKILKLQDMPEEMLDEFDREIDLMNKLRHKNIVQFIGASKVVGKLAILTEFIEFGNCAHLLHQSKKPLEFDFKVKVALDAARAIRFLHQNNILHRDIKPDNLLIMSLDLNAPVAAKLTDFGTSRAVSKLTNQYTTGIGTPSYMAPEILSKKPYDTKADVYSFGILLWALYTQQEPYIWIEHSWEVAQYVLQGKRDKIPADCPSLYAQLIEQCWTQDPDQRPNMESVISALENIVKMSKFWTGM